MNENKNIVGLYLLTAVMIVVVGADLVWHLAHPATPVYPPPPQHSVSLSWTDPAVARPVFSVPTPTPAAPEVFAPAAPQWNGDLQLCHDEVGTPGEVGFTVRGWRPRADGWCHRSDALPVRQQ